MHPGQIEVTLEMVRQLVDEQFPRWRGLPVTQVAAAGTVNGLFRIGDRLAARLPLLPDEVATTRQRLQVEAEAARELLGHTPFPTPEPVAIGEPGAGYPLPWSVQTWVPGSPAGSTDLGASVAFAHDLAGFVRGVRAIDTAGRGFSGVGRGGDLRDHDEWMETCFQNSGGLLDVARLRRLWAVFRELPPSTPAEIMTHGDLIPGNVLVCHGRLTGIIDVGGSGPADPALDLVCAWHLLDEVPRRSLRDELGCDDIEWARGKAWAFEQSMGAVWYYEDSNPSMSRMGRCTLDRVMAEAGI
jgi:aminoglycoside phosphotransferase (APT) family kinase protein